MSSPIVSENFETPGTSASVCDIFRNKLLNNGYMVDLLGYLFDADGKFQTDKDIQSFGRDLIVYLMQNSSPIGSLLFAPAAAASVPSLSTNEWLPCDGSTHTIANYPWASSFIGLFGITDNGNGTFTMPDYAKRYLRCSGTGVAAGDVSEDEVTQVTAGNLLADHTHFIMNREDTGNDGGVWDMTTGASVDDTTVLSAGGSNTQESDRYVLVGSATAPTVGLTSGPNRAEDAEVVDTLDLTPSHFAVTVFMRVGYVVAGVKINPTV